MNVNEPFPVDWNAWRQRWWDYAPSLGDPLRKTADLVERFPDKNFMADEILGYWQVGDRIVELSEGTGIYHERFIGVTVDSVKSGQGTVVWSFAELDELLATLKEEA